MWLFPLSLLLLFPASGRAAKEDFKSLFGSYRREKFVENEGRKAFFGTTLALSTMFPVTSVVKSKEIGFDQKDLSYSSFFDIEGELFLNLNYDWQFFVKAGYFTYDSRRENEKDRNPQLPIFHEFSLKSIPVMGGVKYRFSRQDIVPYVGVAAGMAFVKRRGSYDNDKNTFDEESASVLTAEVQLGLDFYFSSRAGIRLEVAGNYLKLAPRFYDPGGSVHADFDYQPNVMSVRYSSGIFLLF